MWHVTPARILNPETDITDDVLEQAQPQICCECLYHRLFQPDKQERPLIERFQGNCTRSLFSENPSNVLHQGVLTELSETLA